MKKSHIADRLAGRMELSRSTDVGTVDAVFETIGEALAGLDARAALELDDVLHVLKRPQDDDVLGPVDSGTVLDCDPPAGDATLDLCMAPPHSSHSVPFWPCASMRASAMAWMRRVFAVMSCSRMKTPLRLVPAALSGPPPKGPPRPPPDSGPQHVGRAPNVPGRGTLQCSEW